MDKKSVSASILVIYLAIFFSVIGICFSTFVYQNTKIVFKEVSVAVSEGVGVFGDKDLSKNLTKLKLSDMTLGLKPATGDVDAETQIPSTITDEGTSEGYYSTIYVKPTKSYKIILKDIKIESKKNELEVKEERKNIFVAIKDIKNTTKSLKEDQTEIVSFSNINETQKLTFYFWLGALSGEELEGAKISFVLDFVAI